MHVNAPAPSAFPGYLLGVMVTLHLRYPEHLAPWAVIVAVVGGTVDTGEGAWCNDGATEVLLNLPTLDHLAYLLYHLLEAPAFAIVRHAHA